MSKHTAEPETEIPTRPFGEPETRVFLECPKCQHAWEAARILPGAWWGKGITPESIARICYCPDCYAAPPMRVAAAPEEDPPCLAK